MMKQNDFIDYINSLKNKKFTTNRKPSLIVNNFYSLITIIIISISIILYTNYVIPAQKKIDNEKNYNSY
jgi:hypothetical protein